MQTKDGWKQPEVALTQKALAEKQLENPATAAPLAAFIRAMRSIKLQDGMTLLDVGCGAGYYGILCHKLFPQIQYTGADYSKAMIDVAREWNPNGSYMALRFDGVDFSNWDIVLVSQVLEYQSDPWKALGKLLAEKRTGRIIINRLRLTPGTSKRIDSEPCYCGYNGPNYLWNLAEIVQFIKAHRAYVEYCDEWDHNATLVAMKDT